jgi:hypothetical protein
MPTLLKSTDLQCGQREENTPYSSAIRRQYAYPSVFAVPPVRVASLLLIDRPDTTVSGCRRGCYEDP